MNINLKEIDKGGHSTIYEDSDGYIYKTLSIENFLDSLMECHMYCQYNLSNNILNAELVNISTKIPIIPVYKMKKGITLVNHIKTIDTKEKYKIIVELYEILQKLHQQNYYHGDIKPDNIVIINNKLYLIDFSFSKFIPRITSHTSVLNMGTDCYRPPERIFNDLNRLELETVHPFKGDLWSFGVLCIYILSGGKDLYDVFNNEKWKFDVNKDNTLYQCYIDIFKKINDNLNDYLIKEMNIDIAIIPKEVKLIIKNCLKVKSKSRKILYLYGQKLDITKKQHFKERSLFIIKEENENEEQNPLLNKPVINEYKQDINEFKYYKNRVKKNIPFYTWFSSMSIYGNCKLKKRIFFNSLELYYKVVYKKQLNIAKDIINKSIWYSCIFISYSLLDNSISIYKHICDNFKDGKILINYILDIVFLLKGKILYPSIYDYILSSYSTSISNFLVDEITKKIDLNNEYYISFRTVIEHNEFYSRYI